MMQPKRMTALMVAMLFAAAAASAQADMIDAEILVDSTTVRMISLDKMTYSRSFSIKVLNQNGARLADFLEYVEPGKALDSFGAVITDSYGNVRKQYTVKDLDATMASSDLATDCIRAYKEFDFPVYPYTVSIVYQMSYNNGYCILPTFRPLKNTNVKLNRSCYAIESKTGDDFVYSCRNCDIKPAVSTAGKFIRTQWRIDNCDVIRKENYMPPVYEIAPYMVFAPKNFMAYGRSGNAGTWNSFAAWQWPLVNERSTLPEGLKAEVHALTDNCSSTLEKVQKIYGWLRSNTRYVSIQLGIGGLQPMEPAEVYRTKFGDCKALTNIMRVMLAEAGVASNYVEIHSGSNTELVGDIAALTQTNHAILKVAARPEEGMNEMWVECTNPDMPLGYAHSRINGHQAVVYYEDGSAKIERVKSSFESAASTKLETHVYLNPDRSARITFRDVYQGEDGEEYLGIETLSRSRLTNMALGSINVKNANIDSISFRTIRTGNTPHVEGYYEASTDKYGISSSKSLYLPVLVEKFGRATDVKLDRKNGIYIDSDRILSVRTVYHLPVGMQIESVPKTAAVTNGIGSVSLACKTDGKDEGSTLTIELNLETRKGNYPAEDAAGLKELFDIANSAIKSRIIIKGI